MEECEKVNSSAGKDKGKMSHLDEDISNDFLTSWKSASMAGGDDMDFNFEPVTKGNKKAFDFGKLDMDFSLDGEFGKLSSFKLDMQDLDFSSTPKTSTKSKDISKYESVKENHSAHKADDFTFSFDFNRLDDFSLQPPSPKGGNNPSREKNIEDVDSMSKIESDGLHRPKDNGAPEDTVDKRPPAVPEDALNSKSEDLVNAERNLDTSPRSPSNSKTAVDSIQPKGTQLSSQNILAVDAQEMAHESLVLGKTSKKYCDQDTVHDSDFVPESRFTSKPIPEKTTNTHVASETKLRMNSQGSDEEIQATEKTSKPSYAELKAKDPCAKPLLAKTSTQANTEVMDAFSANKTPNKLNNSPSEACIDTVTLPPASISVSDIDRVKPQKILELFADKSSKKSDEKNEHGTIVASSSSTVAFASDIADPSTSGVLDTLSSDAKYHIDGPRSTSKFFSASFRSGSTAAKPTVIAKVSGGNISTFSSLKETKSSATTKLSTLGNNREDITELGAKGRSEEIDENVNKKIRDEVGGNAVSQDGQALKGELVLQSEKKINDPKPSSFQVPPSVSTAQKTKFSNEDPGNLKDKIPSRISISKSNFSEPNRHSSLRFGKKLPGFPSLKLPGNVTTTKHSVSPTILENAKSGRNLEKGVRSPSVTTMIPSIDTVKKIPSTPSLKRKPSEAADVGSIKLPPSKRLSPHYNRMAKEVSTTEVVDEVHRQGTPPGSSSKNIAATHLSPKFDFLREAKMEELGLVESDANIEKAEACAKELEDICSMLKKKHEEAKELLVRALVNNNNLLMLNHPIYEEKIRAVQKFAARVMSKELEAGI